MRILIGAYIVPGVGVRVSTSLGVTDEDIDALINRAIDYTEMLGFKCLAIEIVPYDNVDRLPEFIEKTRKAALESYLLEFPDELGEERPLEDAIY